MVWRGDDGGWLWACLLCTSQQVHVVASGLAAHEAADMHVRKAHHHAQTWVARDRPEFARAVQLAIPLLLKMNNRGTQGHAR